MSPTRAVIAEASFDLAVDENLIGGQAWDEYRTFGHDDTVAAAKRSTSVLCGAVGGAAYDNLVLDGTHEEKDGVMRRGHEDDEHNRSREDGLHQCDGRRRAPKLEYAALQEDSAR